MAKRQQVTRRRLVRDFLEDQNPRRSQRWLADRLEISEAYLSELINDETSEPSLTLALALSKITGVPVERFARG